MVKGPLGSILTFLYSRIWNFFTMLTKKKFPSGNFLNLHTVHVHYNSNILKKPMINWKKENVPVVRVP